MTVDEISLTVETADAGEIPKAGDRLTMDLPGTGRGPQEYVVVEVRAERKWHTSATDAAANDYYYRASIRLEFDHESPANETPAEAVERLIEGD